MACQHATRIQFAGMDWCLGCDRELTAPREEFRPFPERRPAGTFAQFIAQAAKR